MNKLLSASVLALSVILSGSALAKNHNPRGGFQGPGITVSTVAEALQMKDDAPVVLKGSIEKSLGHEKYLFKDASGSVTVEIDDDDWRGLTVTPADKVEIRGEVDKDFFKTEIDVDSVTLLK